MILGTEIDRKRLTSRCRSLRSGGNDEHTATRILVLHEIRSARPQTEPPATQLARAIGEVEHHLRHAYWANLVEGSGRRCRAWGSGKGG